MKISRANIWIKDAVIEEGHYCDEKKGLVWQ
jgi:hypothetical protein